MIKVVFVIFMGFAVVKAQSGLLSGSNDAVVSMINEKLFVDFKLF